ncbi:hypothetical protein PCASD_02258 [Puccinia coronata f. sp. avenae]|uniref:J domain-containing protein n=1 Tax=Puccinia coronata f. sp. avenae TaxID=200324 RepID=A0A2N5VI59_9BASI|nr:hypothetical protein PCASD_02258 [Puccinia coronata f. sp. avenae]
MGKTHQDASNRILNSSSEDEDEDSRDLYKILGLNTREATEGEVRSAYRKQALKYHPDKISATSTDEEKDEARRNFDRIGLAYKILADGTLRQRYDSTGTIDPNPSFLDGLEDQDGWSAYFKDLWSGEVNAQTIEEFANKYRDSEEELNDLRQHYEEFEGSLEEILSHTMCATDACEPRLIKRIDKMIKDGVLCGNARWEETKKDVQARARRAKKARQESREAEQLAKQLGVHDKLYPNHTHHHHNNNNNKGKGEASQEEASAPNPDNDQGIASLQALIRSNAANKHQLMIAKLEAKARSESSSKTRNKKPTNSSQKKRKHLDDDIHNHEEEEEEKEGDGGGGGGGGGSGEPTEDQFQKIQAELMANKKFKKKQSGTDAASSSSSLPTKKGKKNHKKV